MSEFKQYQRKGISEMRDYVPGEDLTGVSVSDEDKKRETLDGGFIARNPVNHADQWYVSREYFEKNLIPIEKVSTVPGKETTFIERLEKEAEELSEKITALGKALDSDGFATKVGGYQYDLLQVQSYAMSTYHNILLTRLTDLKAKPVNQS